MIIIVATAFIADSCRHHHVIKLTFFLSRERERVSECIYYIIENIREGKHEFKFTAALSRISISNYIASWVVENYFISVVAAAKSNQ